MRLVLDQPPTTLYLVNKKHVILAALVGALVMAAYGSKLAPVKKLASYLPGADA